MFLTNLLSPSSVLNVKAADFCQEVLPARFEVVTGLLLILECYAMLLYVLFLMFWRQYDHFQHQGPLFQWHGITSQRTMQHYIHEGGNPDIHCYESLISQRGDMFSSKLHRRRYGKGANIWGFRSSGMWCFVDGCVVHDSWNDQSGCTYKIKGTVVLPYFWNLLSNDKMAHLRRLESLSTLLCEPQIFAANQCSFNQWSWFLILCNSV